MKDVFTPRAGITRLEQTDQPDKTNLFGGINYPFSGFYKRRSTETILDEGPREITSRGVRYVQMSRTRAILLTLSMTLAAVFGAAIPGVATADVERVAPVSSGATGVEAAADAELNYAVAGNLPPRSELVCHSVPAVEICYEAAGDHWWVQDQASDGASAVVYWENLRSGSLYRSGFCVNSLSSGQWGQCNKNYYENSTLNGFPCTWDRSSNENIICSNSGWGFQ
ncbi:hypothetical protein ACOQFL_16480 [Actinopolyspora sp. H202]|uniref:hypothetical protein n=1 Tax=Actinopolyspora sp. H202 TaxID=1500456 RepID=UPI003EE6630B